jgi:signal transduction histidine kinase
MPGIEPEQRRVLTLFPPQSKERVWLHSVLDLLPFPVQLIEPGTARVVFANGAARALPSEPSDEREGTCATFATDAEGARIPPEHWPHRRAARGERLDRSEVTWHTPEGRSYYLVCSGVVPAWDGGPSLVLLAYLDFTRLRCTEQELREAVRVHDEFLSIATHELKDPLSSLLLSIGLLRRIATRQGTVPADLLLERLELCERQGQRLGRMIENLLDTSRIDHGRLRLQLESLDLRDLVRDVVGRYRDQAREAGVEIVVEPSGPVVGGFDRVQLEHAIGNLISNALKYGEGRPVIIRLGGDEATATLEVEDRGIGIAEADRGRIFERFERASDGHREKSLGLGLYIVRSIIEAHGGAIAVRSEPGRGTTFLVRLPRGRPPGDAPTAPGAAG